jgi:hypothetical protein
MLDTNARSEFCFERRSIRALPVSSAAGKGEPEDHRAKTKRNVCYITAPTDDVGALWEWPCRSYRGGL